MLDDGESLYDSRVIVEYLDHRTPVTNLIPQEHNLKIQVRKWESLADGVCDAAVAVITERRRPAEHQDAEFITKQLGKVERGLCAMSDALGDAKWCVDDVFSLADIAVACVLGYLSFRYPDNTWQTDYPNLSRHYKALLKRASFEGTAPSL